MIEIRIEEALKLRGPDLARAAERILRARRAGVMCWRCTRLLAAGARCPAHPRAGPPIARLVVALLAALALSACGGGRAITSPAPLDGCQRLCHDLSIEWGEPGVGGTCCIEDGLPICTCLTANHPDALDPCAVLKDPTWNPLGLCQAG